MSALFLLEWADRFHSADSSDLRVDSRVVSMATSASDRTTSACCSASLDDVSARQDKLRSTLPVTWPCKPHHRQYKPGKKKTPRRGPVSNRRWVTPAGAPGRRAAAGWCTAAPCWGRGRRSGWSASCWRSGATWCTADNVEERSRFVLLKEELGQPSSVPVRRGIVTRAPAGPGAATRPGPAVRPGGSWPGGGRRRRTASSCWSPRRTGAGSCRLRLRIRHG